MQTEDNDTPLKAAGGNPPPTPMQLEHVLERVMRWMKFMPIMAAANLIVGVPAFAISIFVAYAAFEQADATRKMQEAAAWPSLAIHVSFNNASPVQRVAVSLENDGLGPALVESMRVELDGRAMNDWPSTVRALAGGALDGNLSRTDLDHVVKPGEAIELVRVEGDNVQAALSKAIANERIKIGICYCSIYEKCWLHSAPPVETTAQNQCPDIGEEQFGREPAPYFEEATPPSNSVESVAPEQGKERDTEQGPEKTQEKAQ